MTDEVVTEQQQGKDTQGEEEQQPIGDAQLSPEEAEAQLAAGFAKIRGNESAPGEEPGPERTETAAERKPEEQAPTGEPIGEDYDPSPEEYKALQKRVRRAEGQLGGLNSQIADLRKQIKDNPGGVATGEQDEKLEEALRRKEEIDSFLSEFKEAAPLVEEMRGMSQRVDQMQRQLEQRGQQPVDDGVIDRRVNAGIVKAFHPDSDKVVRTAEFMDYALNGGPTKEEFAAWQDLTDAQERANVVSDWEIDHPKWWGDRGSTLFTDDPNSQINLLDRFKLAKAGRDDRLSAQQLAEQRRQTRLNRSATPEGVSADPATVVPDDEGLERGFAKARGSNVR